MYEVERKLRVPHDDVRESVEDLDFVGVVHQRDTYFDHPVRSFGRTDEALRVRRERTVAGDPDTADRLTYKGPRVDAEAKTRAEHETLVGDADGIIDILHALDFTPAGVVDKEREFYRTATCDICLDTVEELGEFVEIEARGQREDVKAAVADVHDLVSKLGLTEAEAIEESYLGLVLEAN